MPKIEKILKKQEDGTKKTIYPATICQAIRDGKTGASLEALLSQFNSIYVQYNGTAFDTRNLIPESMRRAGLVITYMNMDSETITERAVSAVQADNDHWGLNVNWTRIDQFTLSGRITVSSEGTWLVDGEDTGIKAVGPKGDTGLTPWLKTIDNKLHFSYDNVTWEPCSENIAAWFRFNATSSDSQAGTIGKIQISRDNKTWTDLSPEFRNYLRIQGYVATTSALPANQVVGTIYGVGPTYAAEDTAQTNPIYRLYVWNGTSWVDNGQFTSIAAGVVQEMGDSETEVMSQKAVSNKLYELDSKLRTLYSVDVPSSNLEAVEVVKLNNKLLSSGGEKLFDREDDFCTTDFIDVSSPLYNYYFKPQISVSGFGKIAFYYEDKSVAYSINGYDLGNDSNGTTFKLNIPLPIKYIRVSGNNPDSIFVYKARKVNSMDEFEYINTTQFNSDKKILWSLHKVLDKVDTSSLEKIEVSIQENKLLSNGGERVFDQNTFCTTDFIDVSDVLYDYYFKPQISVSSAFGKIGFYFEDKSVAYCINGGDLNNKTNGSTFKLNIALPIKYIRISGNNADSIFVYRAKKDILNTGNICYADTNKLLWLGTSIPEGAEYPEKSCEANGYECINNALGQSRLRFTGTPTSVGVGSGRELTAKVDELKAIYQSHVGVEISQSEFNNWLDKSYERSVLPYIKGESLTITDGTTNAVNGIINPNKIKVSAVVIDHGYNDYSNVNAIMENQSSIDWESIDRSNFVGAFNYLINEIQKINPFVKIIVGGYFDYTFKSSNKPLGKNLCELQTLIANHYNFELLKVWEYTQISWDRFVEGTMSYMTDFNSKYGTSYVVPSYGMDENGNIRSHYLYCPDGIHPHSDKSGNANKRLNAVYTKLLKSIL